MHTFVTFVLTIMAYVIIGFKYRVFIMIMEKCPQLFGTEEVCWGKVSLIFTFVFIIICVLVALAIKWVFYQILAIILGMECL